MVMIDEPGFMYGRASRAMAMRE
jgi:hypothetical protein